MNSNIERLTFLKDKGELTLGEQQEFIELEQSVKIRIAELETERMLLSGVHEEMIYDIDKELDELRGSLDDFDKSR